VKTSDWNNPRLRQIGEQYAADAYDLASELENYGADASVLLLPEGEQRRLTASRPPKVCIPAKFADVLMAILLSLPRPEEGRGRRRKWSPERVQYAINKGMTQYAAVRQETERTGVPALTIERGLQKLRQKPSKKFRNKQPGKKGRQIP
jgi:hypothetical protein